MATPYIPHHPNPPPSILSDPTATSDCLTRAAEASKYYFII